MRDVSVCRRSFLLNACKVVNWVWSFCSYEVFKFVQCKYQVHVLVVKHVHQCMQEFLWCEATFWELGLELRQNAFYDHEEAAFRLATVYVDILKVDFPIFSCSNKVRSETLTEYCLPSSNIPGDKYTLTS